MKMNSLPQPIVSVEWLNDNLTNKELIIIDATLVKVSDGSKFKEKGKLFIKNARVLDIKKDFSDTSSPFPNTMLSPQLFEEKARG